MGERIYWTDDCSRLLFEDSDFGILTSIVEAAIGIEKSGGTAEQLLNEFGNLQNILSANVAELQFRSNIPVEVICELERLKYLVQAVLRKRIQNQPLLDNPDSVANYFRSVLIDKKKEQFHALFLNNNFMLLAEECLQTGTVNHVTVYPRELISLAIRHSAVHIMLVHNHPAGKSDPGMSDILITEELVTACRSCGIHIADHLIIAPDGTFSFRENGLLNSA